MKTKIVANENELSEMYKDGKSLKEMAEHFGCSKSTIQRKLAAIGLMKVRERKKYRLFQVQPTRLFRVSERTLRRAYNRI